jgi:hypothetical protein
MKTGAGARIIYPERDRAIYNKIKTHLKGQGYNGVISPRTLRTEVYTEIGKGDYSLSLKDNAPKLSSNANRELRLKEQDAFVFTAVRMSLLLETIAGPVGNERLHTFPSALPFADEVGGFQNAHLPAVYNGNLYLKVGDTVYLEDFPVEDCYVARTQQETASLKSERITNDGYVPLTPQFAIKGFDNNDLRFRMPNANVAQKIQYTDTSKVVLVFQFKGYIITGAGTGKLNLNFDAE